MRDMHNNVSPNSVSYNTVMNVWANESKSNDRAADQVVALLQELEQCSQTNPKLQPDEWTYRAVWKVIASSHVPDKVERANQLLENMAKHGLEPNRSMNQQLKRWREKQ